MKEKTLVSILTLSLLVISFGQVLKADEAAEKAAVEAAQQWLAKIDEGKFAESYDNAAQYFKNSLKKDQWESSLKAARSPLGKLISRKVSSKEYKTALPGAPDGEYVVILFQTSFENKKEAVETVTPMKDKDGQWRVSGYFIK